MRTGARVGPYEIQAGLGAGGMGEVYRARDTRLDRDVAIKVLPEAFVTDRERFLRFQREARVLASLNHPHIAHVHGLEDLDGAPAIVMELVDGQTLEQRLVSGPLPQDEALVIARQIAEALEAAHAQGIVHRDLKPANVKIRDDGIVKVLDFGLAKAIEPATSTASASMSPTLSIHATQAGIILGTAAYMSPEQARGKAADVRADIWAFGVVLFEMLAGARPFTGDDVSEVLAAVLKSEPEWDALPGDTTPAVRRLLRRCLRKDRQHRLQHIGDARLEIEDAQHAESPEPPGMPARGRWQWAAAIATLTVTALAVGAIAGWRAAGRRDDTVEMRLEVSTPSGVFAQFALSPNGDAIAYATSGRGPILIRDLANTSRRPLVGTEGAEYPFWSPDGRSLGFFANNKLKRIDIDGGLPQVLADVLTPAGGTWGRHGVILYVPFDNGGVFEVPATGGESRQVTPDRSPPLATRLPHFLPDGRRFLFYVARGADAPGVYVGELGSENIRRLIASNSPALYGSGHVWYIRDRSLVAQEFEPSSQALGDRVMHVADDVTLGLFGPNVSASVGGPIAYRAGTSANMRRQLVWFDRLGKKLGAVGEEGALASNPSLSPDGRFVVVQRTVQENIDLWLIDLERGVTARLTDQPAIESMPVWSPDGSRLVFNNSASGGLVTMRIDRTRAPEPLELPAGGVRIACDWSSDGRVILYKQFDDVAGTSDLWALPLDGDRRPLVVAGSAYNERDGQLSPDGKWMAFESDESGASEIYLQPFPGPGAKTRVSVAGGTQVRWRADGREMFYIDADENLVSVTADLTGPAPALGRPAALFKTSVAPIRSISRQQYVVSPDGQRFLILTAEEQGPTPPVTLLFNWKPPAGR